MTDRLDFVSLSLLPAWCWRVAADWLRRGDPPGGVLRRLQAACARDEPGPSVDVRSLAADAIRRAASASITAIPWSDAAYPVALTTIAQPIKDMVARTASLLIQRIVGKAGARPSQTIFPTELVIRESTGLARNGARN